MPKWKQDQLKAWNRFQLVISAPEYRVFWKHRDPDFTKPEEHGGKDGPGRSCTPHPEGGIQTKAMKENNGERFWTPEEVEAGIRSGLFGAWNKNQFDMYIRPIDPNFHHFFIDDVKGRDGVRKIMADGYRPSLVQESSAGNFQVVLRVPKAEASEKGTLEREAANKVALELNKKYGDAGAGRSEQNFRIPGFRNKKTDRNDHKTIIDWGLCAVGSVCTKAAAELERWRETVKAALKQKNEANKLDRLSCQLIDLETKAADPDVKRFAAACSKWASRKGKGGKGVNLSEVDFQVAKEFLEDGWTPERIGRAMLTASPSLLERKKDWTAGYITKTVAAAKRKSQEEGDKRRRQQESKNAAEHSQSVVHSVHMPTGLGR